jgi:hypothetical protein
MRARGPRLSPVGRRPGWIARGRVWPLVLLVVLVLAACNGSAVSTSPPPSPSPGSEAPSGSSGDLPSEGPSTSPTDVPSAEPTDEPTVEPTASQAATDQPSPGDTPSAGGSGACFGSSQTRDDFFGTFAQDVSWPVYCAVLPKGWSVEDGHYQLKNGGRLWIIYRRRSDGAKVVLDQGSVCVDTTPCVPTGDSLGTIPFGDRQADLSSTSGDVLSAVVDETENPAWLLTGSGIDPKDFKTIAAKLHLLDL